MLGSNNFFLDFCLMVFFFSFFPHMMLFSLMSTQCRFDRTEKRDPTTGAVSTEALLSESSKSLAVEALQEHMIQGHRNLGSRGAAAVWVAVLRLCRWGILKRKRIVFQGSCFRSFGKKHFRPGYTWENVESKHAHISYNKQTRESISDSMVFQTSDL